MTPPQTRIDAARVLADLNALRGIGAYKSGVHKPSLTKPHLESLAWLEQRMREAGLTPTMDGIGNVVGVSANTGKKLLAGSHLESQNHAGWLDGPLGVVYALEAARVINADPRFKGAAVDVGCWCDEEGHFGSMLGSRSFVGDVSEAEIDAAVDRTDGRRMRDALAAAGLANRPRLTVEKGRYVGYFEAHIEQGDTLEAADLKIGVVTSIVGIWQYKIVVTGQQNHAGTTRMAIRRDAGLAAAKLLVALDQTLPSVAGPRTVWTAGRITLEPGAPSIIPGRAEVLFQVRDETAEVVRRVETEIRAQCAAASKAGPCSFEVEVLREGAPAHMADIFQTATEDAAGTYAQGKSLRLPSGAGHDAQFLALAMPAGMMFVPSIGGISHHWTENTADADIACGAEVFVAACARLLA
jgi:beta-ureidopropionase / N-carbamoyl-L-amino-acid hydrolase